MVRDERPESVEQHESHSEPQSRHPPVEYEQFIDFFENAAVPMHWVGPDGTVLHANQAELDALGYDREEYVGRHIADFHADKHVIDDMLDRLSSDEELQNYEARMQCKDGSIRHVLIDSCVNWKDGEFVNTRCVTRDVTERKEREQELQRKNEQLEKFARIVSHDLRNPLSVVEGRLQLAKMDGDVEHIGPALKAIQRSQSLIDNLLALAREGDEVADLHPTRLSEVVENCWAVLASTAATLHIETERTIHADATRLRQLIDNLVQNAIDHGGEKVTITVGDLSNQDGFFVADDGPGLPEDEREAVFESGHSTSKEGTGLGLSIVKEIANAHGWDVQVTDGMDGGARFEITGVETVCY